MKPCECGCGQPAPIATKTQARDGHIKGQPVRFIRGHVHPPSRSRAVRWEEQDRGHDTPCWIWQLSLMSEGYGQATFTDSDGVVRNHKAHRLIYEQRVGPVPEGLELDHLCFVRACVNPAHLEPVTHTENMRRNRHLKLDMEKAREIRELAQRGVATKEIADQYGISRRNVRTVAAGKTWT